MRYRLILLLSAIFVFFNPGTEIFSRERIDLSGDWQYQLIGAPASIPGEGMISLPNTLDNARKSVYNPEGDNTAQLRREFSFMGEAIYKKTLDIPDTWKGKNISLFIERTKPGTVKIDGQTIGYDSKISSPQNYDLSEYLKPGKHELEILVNNLDSIPPIVARSSHAVSESTQTNWNGILGEIFLEAKNPFHIKNIRVDDSSTDQVVLNVMFSEQAPKNFILSLDWDGENYTVKVKKCAENVSMLIFPEKKDLWSASNPTLHKLNFNLKNEKGETIDDYSITTGFRKFSSSGNYFTVNDIPQFLRGTINAAVFPLTAFPPMEEESWMKYYAVLKEYGINHVRFHSWTPPEAAFSAADKAGMFLMVELPIWGELDRDLKFHNKFLKEELSGIMEAYSSHPSFVMFSTGNELWGDISLMGEYMEAARQSNPRILSTYGSNVYLGMNGQIGKEDFVVAAKTSDDVSNSVRGSVSFADSPDGGHFNSTYPNSIDNFSDATRHISVPIISHEVGQYQSYPDFREINSYTGNLKPDNLKEFERRAVEAGTFNKNREFTEASGKWAAKLYKAEIEMALRSSGISGFELFGLQDYPGQGTASIGILNSMMKPKGFISPEEWREASSDLTILAEFPKFTFTEGESVEISLLSVNFTPDSEAIDMIRYDTGFDKGDIATLPGTGVMDNGAIYLKMPQISNPQKFTLNLSTNHGDAKNSYDFWVYPKLNKISGKIDVTHSIPQALKWLNEGRKVLLCPDSSSISQASIDPLFTTDFWNYRMFRTICDEMHLPPSPGTLGLLVDSRHPSLSKFPTDNHTDWQWYSIITNSRPLIVDRLPADFNPIIEVIDNVERNFRLALMLECKVGKGKLMILSTDPEKLENYPEGRWFLQSILEYMNSKEFNPRVTLSPQQVENLLTVPSTARRIKELKNETYNSFLN